MWNNGSFGCFQKKSLKVLDHYLTYFSGTGNGSIKCPKFIYNIGSRSIPALGGFGIWCIRELLQPRMPAVYMEDCLV